MIPLPPPLDREFRRRHEICQALAWNGDAFMLGETVLPDMQSKAFWPTAEKALKAQEAGADGRKTFRALIAVYQAHNAYTSKARATKRDYDRYAEMILSAWADDLVADLTTVDAQAAIDSMGETPIAANRFRSFLSKLVAFGIPRGFATLNAVAFTETMGASDPWPSWPEWAFDLFFQRAPAHLALPVVTALFTGQREVDVIAMPRPRASDQTIPVRAQKTGEMVWIPIHSEYRQWLEGVPRTDAVPLHLNTRGEPYTLSGFQSAWQKLMRSTDADGNRIFARFRDERIVFHGVRKNAVINLLEAGCTESQVGAIVNMSEQMVRHYGRDVRVRVLAREGMRLLENRWAELRPTGLPRTGTEHELETKPV